MKINPNHLEQITDDCITAAEDDATVGFCIVCGAEQSGTEPDARNYKCKTCGENSVFGYKEITSTIA